MRHTRILLVAVLMLAPVLASAGVVDSLRKALKHGEDPNAWVKTEIGRIHPLHMYAWSNVPEDKQLEILRLLIEAGAKVNGRDEAGRTALHLAVSRLHSAAAELLLKHGADVNARDDTGRTPIYSLDNRAAYFNSKFVKATEKDSISRSMARMARLLAANDARMDVRDQDGRTPLCLLAANAPGAVLDVLLKAGADPNAADKKGDTPLRRAFDHGNVSAIKVLLAHGARADVDMLVQAVKSARVGVALALARSGMDVNAHDKNGATPLLESVAKYRASSGKEYLRLIRALLEGGANPDEKGRFFGGETTPLKLAAGDESLMALLKASTKKKSDKHSVATEKDAGVGHAMQTATDALLNRFDRLYGAADISEDPALAAADINTLSSVGEIARRIRAMEKLSDAARELMDFLRNRRAYAQAQALAAGGSEEEVTAAAEIGEKILDADFASALIDKEQANRDWAGAVIEAYRQLEQNQDKWRFGQKGEKHLVVTDPQFANRLAGLSHEMKVARSRAYQAFERMKAAYEKMKRKQ